METRVPAQHLFRNIFWFWISILALVLLFAGFPGTSALAANPYKFTDQCEGDPGDGLLSPRVTEGLGLSAGDLDEDLIFDDHGYFIVPVFTNWASPGTTGVQFLLIPQPGPGFRIVTGTAPWLHNFTGRGWHHAR